MSLELSFDQRQAVDAAGTPLKLVDPRTGCVYVLVPESVFERVQSLVSDDLIETYQAQIESAMRAGWDDPVMDDYNDYDRQRRS
jgi:hypothetical protein